MNPPASVVARTEGEKMSNFGKNFVALGFSLALVGCIADGGPTDDPNATIVTSESGQTMAIVERPHDEALDPVASSEDVSTLTEEDYGTEGCWVVLEWCVHPVYGVPYCTSTGCTVAEAIYHCESLIDQYC